MRNNRHSIWIDEAKVELAKQLFESGATASQAAGRIGVTRNAIIGKWHRMGLLRAPKQRSLLRARKPITRKERIARTPKRLPPEFFAEPLRPPVETDIARVSLMDLERHHCRWPVGDPTQGFCGCKPVEGLPYCEPHARRAYRPAETRPKQPENVRPYRGQAIGLRTFKNVEEFVDA